MHEALRFGLDQVFADLRRTTSLTPEVRDERYPGWSGLDGREMAMVFSIDGTGTGVYVIIDDPVPRQLAHVADQIQEWTIEELWNQGRDATWPECPEHRNSHPLDPVVVDNSAVWRCPVSLLVVADVGALTSPQA
jgi:hypothetical protein